MNIRRMTKGFLSVLMVLTMLAGMLPLSAIPANAKEVTVDLLTDAYNWAYNKRGKGYESSLHAYFVSNSLNQNGFKDQISANQVNTANLVKQIKAISGDGVTVTETNVSAGLAANTHYILHNGTQICWYYGGNYVWNGRNSAVRSSDLGWTPTFTLTKAIKISKTTTIPDEYVDVGDEFNAYINVVGHTDYSAQKSKALTYHRNNDNDVYVANPNYNDGRQIWKFKKHKKDGVWDGYYSIENYDKPDHYLNVSGGNIVPSSSNIVIHNYFSTHPDDDSSLWQFVKNNNFNIGRQCYYLQPKKNNSSAMVSLNIDISSPSTEAHLWTTSTVKDGSSAFYIDKINEVGNDVNAVIRNSKNEATRVALDTADNKVKYKTASGIAKDDSQVWIFERQNENELPPVYKIKNRKTGKYLQVDGSDAVQNTINVGDSKDSGDQKWILLGDDLNTLNFISLKYPTREYSYNQVDNAKTILSMDSPNGNTAADQEIKTYANNLTDGQRFTISRYWVDKGDFYTTIRSKIDRNFGISLSKDGKYGEDTETDGISGVVLRQIASNVTPDLQWYFQSLGDGTYAIKNIANEYYLYNDNSSLRAKKDFTRSDSFKWYIVSEVNGNFSLCNKLDFNKAIDIPSAHITANAIEEQNIQFYTANQTNAQLWELDFGNKTSPLWGENLGETFWAYISPVSDTGSYLKCGDVVSNNAGIRFVTPENETAKRKQEYYWKFERHSDGSYEITSCNLQNSVLEKYGGSGNYDADAILVNWENSVCDYWRRWYIRKYAEGYRLESKLDGKIVTFNADGATDVKTLDDSDRNQQLNIIETDMTVASEMPYVKMRLFNYGKAINSAKDAVLPFFNASRNDRKYVDTDNNSEDYQVQDVVPTMSKTLVNGYPYVENNNITSSNVSKQDAYSFIDKSGSLKYLFDDTKDFVAGTGSAKSYNLPGSNYESDSNYQSQCFTVNNPTSLFRTNKKNGLYYYDSLMNAAYFKRDTDSTGKKLTTGNFNLYDYSVSVSNEEYSTANDTITGISRFNGNFFPFNIAHEEGDAEYGTDKTRPTVPSNSDYFDQNEKVPVNYKLNGNTPIDCWFGMTLENTFIQTEDGRFNEKDLQFSFTGDDDVWVYVDGILVLNIGGTHIPQSGSINFATGVVTDPNGTTDLKTLYQTVVNDYKAKGMTYTYNGTVIDDTYIQKNFVQAKDENGNTIADKWTFKGDTKHTLNFYFMERAGGHSYCQLKFNLPKGSLGVSKKVTGLDSELKDPREYTFQLQDAEGNPFTSQKEQKLSELTCIYEKADGSMEEKPMPIGNGNDCKFKLKDGETVSFQGIPNGDVYRVVELDAPSNMVTSSTIARGNQTPVNYYNGENQVTTSTNIFTQITYENRLSTNSLDLVKKVYDADGTTELINIPDAAYYMGLHIFDKNPDSGEIINDYGTKLITVSGDNVSGNDVYKPQTITGLPAGSYYELWEYVPQDAENRYDSPTLSDLGENGVKDYIARLVETGSEPALNDVISGNVNGQTLTVVNKRINPNSISITFKYYDRDTDSGKPATINSNATTYSKLIDLTAEEYKTDGYVDANNNIITGKGKALLNAIIAKVGASATTTGAIGNIVDEYELFTSQETAVKAITADLNDYTYTIGADDNYATHYITKSEAVYHTNSKRQPIKNTADREKWVTYYKSGEVVDAEADTFIDYDEITNITVWLYNKPRTYTITTHVPEGNNANGKEITYTALYNQQLGVNKDNNLKECKDYCERYSIPLDEYDTRGTVDNINKTYTGSGALETFDGKDFSYWTDAKNGGKILSTDLSYLYRVTHGMDLYANYGKSFEKGVFSTDGGLDVYYDAKGIKRIRINTVMNPYGFEFGSSRGNPNIKYAAAAYLVPTKPDVSLDSIPIDTVKNDIKTKAAEIATTIESKKSNKGTGSFEVPDVYKVTVVVYEVSDSKLLTNKNRLNFMASYTAPTGTDKKTVLAFTSLYYDGKDDSSDNGWYVSDNYISQTLTSKTSR